MLERMGRLFRRKLDISVTAPTHPAESVVTPASPISEPAKALEPLATIPVEPAVVLPIPMPVEAIQQRNEESAEIPFDFYAVVADDRGDYRAFMQDSVRTAVLGDYVEGRSDVRAATGTKDLFRRALRGNRGQQATVVFLDDDYSSDNVSWDITPKIMDDLGKELGFDLSNLIETHQERQGFTTKERSMLKYGLAMVDSVDYAVLLRAAGYKGKVFIVSGSPPEPSRIKFVTDQLKDELPEIAVTLPVDGCLNKAPIKDPVGMYYATKANDQGEWDKERGKGTFSDSIRVLLKG